MFRFLLASLLPTPLLTAAEITLVPDEKGFSSVVRPYLENYCLRCHGPEKQKSDFRVDTQLKNDFLTKETLEHWKEALDLVQSQEMPPQEEEKQPTAKESAAFAEWVTEQIRRAEAAKRSGTVVLRRLNKSEYNRTLRDLLGIDFDAGADLPEDPAAGGFDNNGQALTMSPLQIELYYKAAFKALDRAIVAGPAPPMIHWKFEPEEGIEGMDRKRVERDGQRIILNAGKNGVENGMVVVHHNSWDKVPGFRDFALKHAGPYVLRLRAASRVPSREAVVAAARKKLEERLAKELDKNPKRAESQRKHLAENLAHFEKDAIYDYGPARVKITQHLGSQPIVVAEIDIDAPPESPKVYEIPLYFTTERAGLQFEYAYSIPKMLENFWMQNADDFARPELLIDSFELQGPIHAQWPPPSHRQLLDDAEKNPDESAAAKQVLEKFMARAWRRPVTAEEVAAKLALFTKARPERESFLDTIKVPLAAVLTSPHFLFMVEPTAGGSGQRFLTDYEIAARLSYFLWSTMPDEELRAAASRGSLRNPDALKNQVQRMLASPRAVALAENFAGQWIGLRKVGGNPPAENLYPHYDRHLEVSMIAESQAFFDTILRQDLSVLNFIKSDFVTINERLARFYGIPGVKGDAMRKVAVPADSKRGGLVTQASVLTITSNGTRTSPVVRGTWIMKNLLGTDPGLPVANAGEIAPKVPGIDKATVRQRLQIHRELPACARCHDKIDPLGFALENYNASGEWRDQEGFGYNGRIEKDDPKIDASATLPDGTPINGVLELQAALLKKEDLFLQCLSEKMLVYALGRELTFSERPLIAGAAAHLKKNRYTLRALIEYIVTSEPFLRE